MGYGYGMGIYWSCFWKVAPPKNNSSCDKQGTQWLRLAFKRPMPWLTEDVNTNPKNGPAARYGYRASIACSVAA